jgi:hypothetical protein
VIRVLVAGEGPHELGDWAKEPQYRPQHPRDGVLLALMRRIQPDGWTVGRAVVWRHIRRFRVGERTGDDLNLRRLALDAREAECDVIVFSRDRDRDEARQRAIEGTLAAWPATDPRVGGGLAVESMEGWIRALRGERGSENHRWPKLPDGTTAFVALVESADLDRLPADAASLRLWLERVRVALGAAE